MDQPNGHPCPECGAPRHADRTPTCACTRRTADALRDARTAEAAAAEDFDPLRIRPYVDLNGTRPDGLPEATKGTPSASGTPRAAAQGGASADTAGGAAGPAAGGRATHDESPATRAGTEGPDAPDATMTLKAISPDAAKTRGSEAAAPAPGGAADTGTAPHTGAAHTGSPADAANRASTPGLASAAPHAGGAADTGTAPHAGAAHTGDPAGAAPGAENHASAPGSTAAASHPEGGAAGAASEGENHASAAATPEGGGAAGTGSARRGPQETADSDVAESPDATMALRAVRLDGTAPPATAPAPDDRTSVFPTPLALGTAQPSADDLGLFDDSTRPLRAVSAGSAAPAAPRHGTAAPRNRRRRGALIAASGAVVAVLGAAGWASGLFSYETPSRDTAAPDDVRASVPDASPEASSAEPSSEDPSASPSASASTSESPSASASASGSPSPSASSSAPSASATAEPSVPPSAGGASSAPAVAPEPEEPVDTAPVLRRGDRGPEVVELQQRLRMVWLYQGDTDGWYSRRVEEAVRHYQWSRGIHEELGVYGPQTRSRLESETGTP